MAGCSVSCYAHLGARSCEFYWAPSLLRVLFRDLIVSPWNLVFVLLSLHLPEYENYVCICAQLNCRYDSKSTSSQEVLQPCSLEGVRRRVDTGSIWLYTQTHIHIHNYGIHFIIWIIFISHVFSGCVYDEILYIFKHFYLYILCVHSGFIDVSTEPPFKRQSLIAHPFNVGWA